MIRRGKRVGLVSVLREVLIEVLQAAVSIWIQGDSGIIIIWHAYFNLCGNLPRRIFPTPILGQLLIRPHGAQPEHLPADSKGLQLVVTQPEILVIGLAVVFGDGLKLRGWRGIEEVLEDGKVEVVEGPGDEFAKVVL